MFNVFSKTLEVIHSYLVLLLLIGSRRLFTNNGYFQLFDQSVVPQLSRFLLLLELLIIMFLVLWLVIEYFDLLNVFYFLKTFVKSVIGFLKSLFISVVESFFIFVFGLLEFLVSPLVFSICSSLVFLSYSLVFTICWLVQNAFQFQFAKYEYFFKFFIFVPIIY